MKYKCPCCGYLTLTSGEGKYDICPICFWEDDPVQRDDHDFAGGANKKSLNVAQVHLIEFGACDKSALNNIRKPDKQDVSNLVKFEMAQMSTTDYKPDILLDQNYIHKCLVEPYQIHIDSVKYWIVFDTDSNNPKENGYFIIYSEKDRKFGIMGKRGKKLLSLNGSFLKTLKDL